nr:CopA [Starmerella bombicola]
MQHFFTIENVHCSSCEGDIREVLQKQDPAAHVQFLQNREVVKLETDVSNYDIQAAMTNLHAHGFDVRDANQAAVFPSSPAGSRKGQHSSMLSRLKSMMTRQPSVKLSKRELNHAQICVECRSENRGTASPVSNDDVSETIPQNTEAFRAVFAVEGMTCASCASSISAAVKAAIPDVLDVSADPIKGAAYVLLTRRLETHQAAEAIEDAGFTATLTEVLPLSTINVKEYSIGAFIRGMTCASCSNTVKNGLEALPYVSKAHVEVLDGRASIITTRKVSTSEIRETVEDLGYDIEFIENGYTEIHSAQAQQNARTITLEVLNIFCERCPERIMNVLNSYGDAVDIVDPVSLSTPYVKFTYLPSPPNLTIRSIQSQLAHANPDLGFEIVRPRTLEEMAAENQQREKQAILHRLYLTSAIALPTMMLMFNSSAMMNYKLMFLLSTPVYFFAADIFHRKAMREIKTLFNSSLSWSRRLFHFGSMNLLMSMGTSISYWASIIVVIINGIVDEDVMPDTYFDSVIFLAFFLLVGRYLDIYSKIKTTSAVSLVSKGRPDTVELWNSDTETTETIPLDLIEVGDFASVFPGQRSAVDGVVQRGSSDFNESMLTGESLPVPKSTGDEVYAGTLNSGQQSLIIKVTAVGEGTLLEDIVDAVRMGQMQRAPIERYVEEFTGMFVPLVVYLAAAVWAIWYFVSKDILWSMQFAIATFVVACPCGIGLAAPTALYIGSGLAAKYGILARGGGDAFQEGAKLQVMCLDKTGTITEGGDLHITDSWGAESDEAVQLAVRLEGDSVHPLAKAVIEYGQGRKLTTAKCANVQHVENKGRGMKADITGGDYTGKVAVLGNERVIKEVAGVEPSKEQKRLLMKWKNEGKSVILLAIKSQGILLMLAAADQIRKESRTVIHRLHQLDVQCWMISGDNEETARAVARKVGIPPDRVIANVLPQQKADKVQELQMVAGATSSQYGRAIVGMVGDGINDAPALAASDVGVALGRGADIALSSSQFVLLREDLRALPLLVEISKAVMRKVKMNFFWAAIYNIVAIPVAAGALYPWTQHRLNPVWASLAMAMSSVSVMTSSLMLRRFRPRSDA